jgi:2-C-methyl-D-erythritol 4-phosphate cytidylyltransferase
MGEEVLNYAIILAGGNSVRFSKEIPKQFVRIAGKSIIEHTIEIFENIDIIHRIIIVINPNYKYFLENIILEKKYKKIFKVLNGGDTRQESSKIGVFAIKENNANVLIHDAARPFLSEHIIKEVIQQLDYYNAVDVAVPSTDTIIIKDDNSLIKDIPDRKDLMLGQTPQGFKLSVIKKAYELYENNPISVTDDCGLILKYGLSSIGIVEGDRFNIKITNPEDLYLADKIFQIKSVNGPNDYDLKQLKNRVIVIFGGNRGIGKEISRIAKENGAIVYCFSRSNGVDITKYDTVRGVLLEVYNRHNRIDYIINTAAVLNYGEIESRKYESIVEEININYYGTIVVVKESIPYVEKSNGSILLFTSSSYTRGREFYSIYSSTKSAIVNFAQAIAAETIKSSIKINVINPERTNTEMRKETFGNEDPSTLLNVEYVARQTLKALFENFTGQIIDIKNLFQN